MPDRLLDRLFEISTWKRAAIVIVVGGAFFVAEMSREHPEQVFDIVDAAIRRQPCEGGRLYMSPLYSENQREVNRLEQSLGPAMLGVVAWRVDLEANRQRMVAYAVADAYRPMADQIAQERWRTELPLFGTNETIDLLLGSIMAGQFACADARQAWPALRRFPLAEVCVIGVPPYEGSGLGGFLGWGWQEPIAAGERDRIEAAFRTAATALVWRTHPR